MAAAMARTMVAHLAAAMVAWKEKRWVAMMDFHSVVMMAACWGSAAAA